MNKITITVNTHLIDKKKLIERDYTNKEGKEVLVKELKLDIIPLKEKKIIKMGDTWEMWKVGFVKQSSTKEEKENKTELPIIGDAIRFENKVSQPNFDKDSKGQEINPEDIPF